jgi:hypothetical protein
MSLKAALSRANPNTLADMLRQVDIGMILAAGIPVYRRRFNFNTAAVSAYQQSTLQCMPLGDSPASNIHRATVIAGGVTGELTIDAYGTTPGTGHIAVAPNGDIVALGADAITSVDVTYLPEKLKVVEFPSLTVVAATGVCLLPSSVTGPGVVLLLEAESLVGTIVGKKRILVPGAVNPGSPSARLSVDKTQVNFTVADAITSARVKVAIVPPVDTFALFAAAETTI